MLLYYHKTAVVAQSKLELIWSCKLEKSKKIDIDLVRKREDITPTLTLSCSDYLFRQSGTPKAAAIWDATRQFEAPSQCQKHKEATNQRQHGPKRYHNLFVDL
jgi:hypothetical protein